MLFGKKHPESLDEAVDTLVYAGKDPYVIILQDVFHELATSGHAIVDGNRLSFSANNFLAFDEISKRAQEYLKRARIGINRYSRRMVY